MVYDISSLKSFEEVRDYYCGKIKDLCDPNIPIILLGNKTDKEEERQVKQIEGVALALSYNYKFQEASALKNENVADSFAALIELWNIEYRKNLFPKAMTIKNVSKKENIIHKTKTVQNINNNSLDINDKCGFMLEENNKKKKKKHKIKWKDCC